MTRGCPRWQTGQEAVRLADRIRILPTGRHDVRGAMHLARHMQTHERRWTYNAGPLVRMRAWRANALADSAKEPLYCRIKKGIKTMKVMLPGARKGKDGGEWVDLARERRPPDRAVVHRQEVISCGRAGQSIRQDVPGWSRYRPGNCTPERCCRSDPRHAYQPERKECHLQVSALDHYGLTHDGLQPPAGS